MTDPLVRVQDLTKHYPITKGVLRREVGRTRAVDGVDFEIGRGETLGLVGESGCGKSTVGTTLLRLEEPTAGDVYFDGEPVSEFDGERLKQFRREAQMIFQDPVSSFDPRMTVGQSVAEPLQIHGLRDADRRRAIVEDLLDRVGMMAEDADAYPNEFSGGQKQRIALARALSTNPRLIVADEPVSALDVSVQSEILSLLDSIQEEFGLSLLFISHDMGVVREICDRVAVMYLGEIVEYGDTATIFESPQHPYTRALLASVLPADPTQERASVGLTGPVPDPSAPPDGCRFHTRCPEIISPASLDIEQSTWRSIMDLRGRLEEGNLDTKALRTMDGAGNEDEIPAAIRAQFDLPDRLADQAAEKALTAAISDLANGDEAEAARRLRDAFPTPCTQQAPTLTRTEAGSDAACHLHDPALADGIDADTMESSQG